MRTSGPAPQRVSGLLPRVCEREARSAFLEPTRGFPRWRDRSCFAAAWAPRPTPIAAPLRAEGSNDERPHTGVGHGAAPERDEKRWLRTPVIIGLTGSSHSHRAGIRRRDQQTRMVTAALTSCSPFAARMARKMPSEPRAYSAAVELFSGGRSRRFESCRARFWFPHARAESVWARSFRHRCFGPICSQNSRLPHPRSPRRGARPRRGNGVSSRAYTQRRAQIG